jgi:formylglycine-generating enzyme required for sulfatase activity
MVKVDTFYVDSTEVTVAQYGAFLAAKNGDTSGQPAVCSWNTSYYDTSIPMSPDNHPMGNVDWCDATAFCSWAGKRLCGKKGGGAIARADLFTAGISQWYLACGGPNGGTHPNNNSTCNSNDGFGNIAPVATFPGCQGYYPGLYDMEGNVAEWVDGCAGDTGKDDTCYLMGGGIYDQKSYCTEVYEDWQRNDTAAVFGFRCCSG